MINGYHHNFRKEYVRSGEYSTQKCEDNNLQPILMCRQDIMQEARNIGCRLEELNSLALFMELEFVPGSIIKLLYYTMGKKTIYVG